MKPALEHLEWPFFEPRHAELAVKAHAWAARNIRAKHSDDLDAACRKMVRALGKAGWLKYAIGGKEFGATADAIEVRSLCILRETLAYYSGLADFCFALQGLGSGAISLFGSEQQKRKYLARVASGHAVAALAISEPEAGSDVAALQCQARLRGNEYELTGEKTWISNGGFADFYLVLARTDEEPGPRGISAFIVEPSAPGFSVQARIEVTAPHPLAHLRFRRCRIPAQQRLGASGDGFKIAMATLDVFRSSVAAAALGFARRALHEALQRSSSRKMFGHTLADFQLTQAKLAEMATEIDAAALLTYRAAWMRDRGSRVTAEAAMAKMTATEMAQKVIDMALQMFGGQGVVKDETVERLYREIRPLRIYEGATEVQQMIIARELLKAFRSRSAAHA